MRFAGLRFKQITNTAGIANAEFFDDFARLIVRIVVYHQDFPGKRGRQLRRYDLVQSRSQNLASVKRANDDRDVALHLTLPRLPSCSPSAKFHTAPSHRASSN